MVERYGGRRRERGGTGEVLFVSVEQGMGVGAEAAEVIDGTDLAATLGTILSDAKIAFADIHFAKPGCFAARARRA